MDNSAQTKAVETAVASSPEQRFFFMQLLRFHKECRTNCPQLEDAPDDLKDDNEVVMLAVDHFGPEFQHASERIRDDKELVIAAVKISGIALRYASKKLQDDKQVVLAAVTQHGFLLEFASSRLQDDEEVVVLAAFTDCGRALEYASERLKSNKNFIMSLVVKYWSALRYASEGLQDDKEVVLRAVATEGYALKFASKGLQDDKEVVLCAVANDGQALMYASKRFENDTEVVMTSLTNDEKDRRCPLSRVAETLLKDVRFLTMYISNMRHKLDFTVKEDVWQASRNLFSHRESLKSLIVDLRAYNDNSEKNRVVTGKRKYGDMCSIQPTNNISATNSYSIDDCPTAMQYDAKIRNDLYKKRWCVNLITPGMASTSENTTPSTTTSSRSSTSLTEEDHARIWSFSGLDTFRLVQQRFEPYVALIDAIATTEGGSSHWLTALENTLSSDYESSEGYYDSDKCYYSDDDDEYD